MLTQTTVFLLYAKHIAPNIFHILFLWLQTLKIFPYQENKFNWFHLLQFSYLIGSQLFIYYIQKSLYQRISTMLETESPHFPRKIYVCHILFLNIPYQDFCLPQVKNHCLRNCYVMIWPVYYPAGRRSVFILNVLLSI